MSGTSWGPVATETLSRWGRRLIATEDGSGRGGTGSVDGAPRWLAGLAAGFQAALLSLAVVVLPTVAAYVATSADPSNQDVGPWQAAGVGAGLWLLAHGSPLVVDGVQVTLVPLGLTALALFSAYASARRTGRPDAVGWAVGVGTYAAVATLVALLVGSGSIASTVLGSACVAAGGLGAGLLAQPGAPRLGDVSRPLWRRLPRATRVGAAAGLMAASALVIVACGVVVGWLVVRRSSVGEVVTSLGVDVVGWTTLTLAQLALVPDVVAWALAFVVGPGFAVGSGTHFTAAEIVSGPLPALPLLGALPTPGSTSALTAWWPLVTVLVGAGAGWWVHRRSEPGVWWHPLVSCLTAALVGGVATGVLVGLASGSLGPGRMSEVGGSGALVGAAVAIGTLVGSALVALPGNPEVRSEASRRWQRVRPGGYVVVPDDTATGEVRIDRVGSGTEPAAGAGGAADDATRDDATRASGTQGSGTQGSGAPDDDMGADGAGEPARP